MPAQPKVNIVPYKELLRRAHELGLTSLLTDIVQIPGPDNDGVAIMRATATLEKEGVTRTFQGTGDAAKNNAAPAMQNCLIRLAETRAKARALRDAVNVGEVAAEEMADYEDARPVPVSSRSRGNQPPLNDSGVQCSLCFAPNLRPHLPNCRSLAVNAA